MKDYVDNYLSYVKDDNKFFISSSAKSVTLSTRSGEYVDLSKEDDILTFIDMLGSNFNIKLHFISPYIDGGKYDRYADYDLISKNPKVYFSSLSITTS